ncbi:putative phenol 2-monooxygenase [Tuber indicum]|nr:putative phenol 2-monooxygenase [Tuber indicum]
MPKFTKSGPNGNARISPSHLNALPRLTPPPPVSPTSPGGQERYEVVIVGSGPAGILSSVLLARYGITSRLTVDEKHSQTELGQADGLQPRTLEILQSLDLAHEILTQGCQFHEVGFWNPGPENKGIVRTNRVPNISVPARFLHEVTIHQGRIERILNEDLERNGGRVERGWRVTGFEIDTPVEEEGFPVVVRMVKTGEEWKGEERVVRCKYLLGADGARSVVRQGMGLRLEGDHTDHVWGVMDTVVKTNFPDIRRKSAIHSAVGSVIVIPRERISPTQAITRIYCQMEGEVEKDPNLDNVQKHTDTPAISDAKRIVRERRSKISVQQIQLQTKRVLSPYSIEFGEVDWWAAYQIGQRVSPRFSQPDCHGTLRVHIAGDACHTHSPKSGQGMNVSMMDAYNFSWKVAHVLNGLVPPDSDLLATYQHERLDIAQQLIDFDREFSKMFSGRIGGDHGLSHEQFQGVYVKMCGFTSGCGIEYREGMLVKGGRGPLKELGNEDEYLAPGRRVVNAKVLRFCDGNPRDIQDEDLPSTARYRILTLLPTSFKHFPDKYAELLTILTSRIPSTFPPSMVEVTIFFPGERGSLEWTDFPPSVREKSEWLVFGDEFGEVYAAWGVDEEVGALAVVRPDGYVGAVAALSEVVVVENWLGKVLVKGQTLGGTMLSSKL